MSRISEVIKNKNKVERIRKTRQREEILKLKNRAAFDANLSEAMRVVDILLDDKDVESVTIQVPEKLLANFGEALYSEILSGYEIEQLSGEPDKFRIRFKAII